MPSSASTATAARPRRAVAAAVILLVLLAAVVAYPRTWGDPRFRCEHSNGSWTPVGVQETSGADRPTVRYGCVRTNSGATHQAAARVTGTFVGATAWPISQPLVVTAAHAQLTGVRVTSGGVDVPGRYEAHHTRWTSTAALGPATTYTFEADGVAPNGAGYSWSGQFRTAAR